MAFSVALAGAIGSQAHLNAEWIALLDIAIFAVITFGYRAVRHFFPWATE